MRHGRIIEEEAPEKLMRQYQCSSLDQIVLRICKRDQEANAPQSGPRRTSFAVETLEEVTTTPVPNLTDRKVFYSNGKVAKAHGDKQIMSPESSNVTFINYRYSDGSGAKSDSSPGQGESQQCFARTVAKGLMGSVKARRQCISRSYTMLRRIRGLIWATYLATFRHPA